MNSPTAVTPKPFRALVVDNTDDQRIWNNIDRRVNGEGTKIGYDPASDVISDIVAERVPLDLDVIKREIAKGDVGTIVMPADIATALVSAGKRDVPVFKALWDNDKGTTIVAVARDAKEQAEAETLQISYGPMQWGGPMEVITEQGLKPIPMDAPLRERLGNYDVRATVRSAVTRSVHRRDLVPEPVQDPVARFRELGIELLGAHGEPMSVNEVREFVYNHRKTVERERPTQDQSAEQDPKQDMAIFLTNLSQGAVQWGVVRNEARDEVFMTRGKVADPAAFIAKIAGAIGIDARELMPRSMGKGAGVAAIPSSKLDPSCMSKLRPLRGDPDVLKALTPVGFRLGGGP